MKPSVEVRELVLRTYKAMGSGEATFMSQQDGTLAIGTDPDEWWVGHETFARVLAAQAEALQGATVVGDPQTYSHGDVGWWADQGKVVLADGTEIPLRITGVCEKEADGWKVVQLHVSIGIPNADTDFGDVTL